MTTQYQQAVNELRSIRDMIRWAVSCFNKASLVYGHGAHSAWDEAVYLVLSALHLAPNTDDRVMDAMLTRKERQTIVQCVRARIEKRLPAAYINHEAWFAGLKFYVDERVIVPRSPLAELIERSFSPWIDPDKVSRILDVCTGSGCIAIACAVAFPDAKVDAIDISPKALAVAKKNVAMHEAESHVNLIQSDVFKKLGKATYDIIISNPPYVSDKDWKALPAEYHHEPSLALKAGKEGLDIVNIILKEARHFLSPEGILIVEVGDTEEALIAHYPEVPFTWLEFERGGDGVFLLTAEQLKEYF